MDEKYKLEIIKLRGEIRMLKVRHLELSIQFWKMNYNQCILEEDKKELAVKLLEVIQKEEKELANFMDAWMNNKD